jgi:hypothetical protein
MEPQLSLMKKIHNFRISLPARSMIQSLERPNSQGSPRISQGRKLYLIIAYQKYIFQSLMGLIPRFGLTTV